jgi:hypothetical protein
MPFTKTVWTKEKITQLLMNDNEAVIRGILRIYNSQTSEEKNMQTTVENNGIGFNRVDSDLLSSFAEQIKSGKSLSKKQMDIARTRMKKYSGQLLKFVKRRELTKETMAVLKEKYEKENADNPKSMTFEEWKVANTAMFERNRKQ